MQGAFVPRDCVSLNCQDVGHLTSTYPNEKLFTFVEEKKKLFEERKVIYDDDWKLVDRYELTCADQGMFVGVQHNLKDEGFFLSCSIQKKKDSEVLSKSIGVACFSFHEQDGDFNLDLLVSSFKKERLTKTWGQIFFNRMNLIWEYLYFARMTQDGLMRSRFESLLLEFKLKLKILKS